MGNEKITSAEKLCDELFKSLYQKFQAQIDWWIVDHIRDYEGEDKDTYKKMIDGFKEDIEPDIMIRGMQKDKRETLKPFYDEQKKEK